MLAVSSLRARGGVRRGPQGRRPVRVIPARAGRHPGFTATTSIGLRHPCACRVELFLRFGGVLL